MKQFKLWHLLALTVALKPWHLLALALGFLALAALRYWTGAM